MEYFSLYDQHQCDRSTKVKFYQSTETGRELHLDQFFCLFDKKTFIPKRRIFKMSWEEDSSQSYFGTQKKKKKENKIKKRNWEKEKETLRWKRTEFKIEKSCQTFRGKNARDFCHFQNFSTNIFAEKNQWRISVTRCLDYFSTLAIFINEHLPNGIIQNLPK